LTIVLEPRLSPLGGSGRRIRSYVGLSIFRLGTLGHCIRLRILEGEQHLHRADHGCIGAGNNVSGRSLASRRWIGPRVPR